MASHSWYQSSASTFVIRARSRGTRRARRRPGGIGQRADELGVEQVVGEVQWWRGHGSSMRRPTATPLQSDRRSDPAPPRRTRIPQEWAAVADESWLSRRLSGKPAGAARVRQNPGHGRPTGGGCDIAISVRCWSGGWCSGGGVGSEADGHLSVLLMNVNQRVSSRRAGRRACGVMPRRRSGSDTAVPSVPATSAAGGRSCTWYAVHDAGPRGGRLPFGGTAVADRLVGLRDRGRRFPRSVADRAAATRPGPVRGGVGIVAWPPVDTAQRRDLGGDGGGSAGGATCAVARTADRVPAGVG